MTNEEFQKLVLEKLAVLEKGQTELKNEQKEIKEKVNGITFRQDEIYQVVRAIEHSNQVGRSELDSQNMRIAKVEGKFKKAAKVFDDEDIEKASNL